MIKKILIYFAHFFPPDSWLRRFLRREFLKIRYRFQKIDQDKAKENLKDSIEVLNELGIEYWLEAGTCLGAIREKKFIEHDFDIDIGLFAKDVARVSEIRKKMIDRGFEIYKSGLPCGTPEHGFEQAFIRHGINVDHYYFYETEDTMWHGAWTTSGMKKHVFNKELFFPLKKITFLNLETFVPNPPEEYLETRYGDWRTPRKDWDWQVDPLCIEKK